MNHYQTDIVIIGAGPGGSSAAYWLAKQGIDVLMVDKSQFPRDKTCGDAIAPRSLAALERMGLLSKFDARPFGTARAFASRGRSVCTPMGFHDSTYPLYSLVIRRTEFDDMVRCHAIETGSKFIGGFDVRSVEYDGDGVTVSGQRAGHTQSIRARLAIIAVGANMALLRKIGILKKVPKTLLAARAYFEGFDPDDDLLDFYFGDVIGPGYGWIFPFGDGRVNVGAGFLVKPGRKLNARAAFDFFLEQNADARKRLGDAERIGPVKGYPLRIDFANAPTYDDGMLLVGEAAGMVNPLTGEGIDFALESGEIAARFAAETLQHGDVSRRALSAYDRLLRQKYQSIFVSMERLRRLYINPLVMPLLVDRANRHPELAELLGAIVTATTDPRKGLQPSLILKYLFA